MKFIKFIDLPPHAEGGGFDHAAVHAGSSRLHVAHTSNDAVDVIDCAEDRFLLSIPNLRGVAGVLVSEESGMVFTSNRGEDTIGMFRVGDEENIVRVNVGVRPNGLAFDAARGLLLAANVGDPSRPETHTVSIVDIARCEMIQSVRVEGRTRWTIFEAGSDCFFVNIADPPQIAVIERGRTMGVARTIAVPEAGPHGLDFDAGTNRLFCACDSGRLLALDATTGKKVAEADLSGAPDVIFFNRSRKHLYVAAGEPGVIDVFETDSLRRLEVLSTGAGAHTFGYDASRDKIYAFLPQSHQAAVFLDE